MRYYPALFAVLLAVLVAACGGSTADNGNTGETGDTTTSEAPSSSTDTGGGTSDGDLNGAPELVALLPTSVDGMNFVISSFDYSKLPLGQGAMIGDPSLEDWLGQVGKTWADVRFATASTEDYGSGSKSALVTLLQVVGADQAAMLEWWGGSSLNSGGYGSTVTLGANTVDKLAIPGATFYQWIKGDTLYWAVADPEAFGDQVIAAVK